MPSYVGGGKIAQVWLAIRNQGAQSGTEISKRCGLPERQIGPILYALCHMGAATALRRGNDRRYVSSRLAKWAS